MYLDNDLQIGSRPVLLIQMIPMTRIISISRPINRYIMLCMHLNTVNTLRVGRETRGSLISLRAHNSFCIPTPRLLGKLDNNCRINELMNNILTF